MRRGGEAFCLFFNIRYERDEDDDHVIAMKSACFF